jgi:uncharacterized membrane protein YhaH (DUF805 family)
MRGRLRAYWWVWLIVAVAGGIGNEIFDSATNGGSHPLADVVIGVALALIVCYLAGIAAGARRPR